MTNPHSNSVAVLALNPAVDIGYELPQLIADRKVQADTTAYHPGQRHQRRSRAHQTGGTDSLLQRHWR